MGCRNPCFCSPGNEGAWTLNLKPPLERSNDSAPEGACAFLGPIFVRHLVDHLSTETYQAPRVLGPETGGCKGRSREVSRDELHTLITDRLDRPAGILGGTA
jgi:hypothetical protein